MCQHYISYIIQPARKERGGKKGKDRKASHGRKGRKECTGRQGRGQSNMPAHRDREGTGRQGTVKHASTTCVT